MNAIVSRHSNVTSIKIYNYKYDVTAIFNKFAWFGLKGCVSHKPSKANRRDAQVKKRY